MSIQVIANYVFDDVFPGRDNITREEIYGVVCHMNLLFVVKDKKLERFDEVKKYSRVLAISLVVGAVVSLVLTAYFNPEISIAPLLSATGPKIAGALSPLLLSFFIAHTIATNKKRQYMSEIVSKENFKKSFMGILNDHSKSVHEHSAAEPR